MPLADTKNGMLPAKAFGSLLLARNAVAQRGDERVGSHDALHRLECLVETGGLDCQDDFTIGGRRLAGTDGREIARACPLTVSASFA